MNLQAKMLRVLEVGEMERVGSSKTKRVDVRVISATNAHLEEEVQGGRFRQDLLFRLNTIEIHLPPLRERREDIPLLAAHFLSMHAQRYRKRISGFDHAAMQLMLDNPWQGNVRELNHVIERAVLMAQDSQIKPADLALRSGARGQPAPGGHEHRGGGGVPDQEGAGALQRQRQPRRQRPGSEPQRAVPPLAALRPMTRTEL